MRGLSLAVLLYKRNITGTYEFSLNLGH